MSTVNRLASLNCEARIATPFTVLSLTLDGFSSFEQSRQALPVADATPNLMFDTSLSTTFVFIEQFIGRVGADRVVFGTDQYSGARSYGSNHLLDELLRSELPGEAKRAILSENIRRVLHVAAQP